MPARASTIAKLIVAPQAATGAVASHNAPYLRAWWSSSSIFTSFIVASLPAAVIGIWQLGESLDKSANDWRFNILGDLGFAADRLNQGVVGLVYLLPLLGAALLTAFFWERLFAALRMREEGVTWVMTAWLFTLLLPQDVTPLIAILSLSFGVVVGHHIFGGAGRNIVSPALLAVLFVHVSYPDLAVLSPAVGNGAASLMACAVGAAYLVFSGSVSWRTLFGGAIGLALAAALADLTSMTTAPWYGQAAAGQFAFVLVFIATDPGVSPLTRASRWAYGLLFGALTIIIRVLDPSAPEGSLFAALLASLAVPLLDHLTLRRYRSTVPRPVT